MRALTLWQPWATLIALGAKQWETRSWAAEFRGMLAIHAAAAPSGVKIGRTSPFIEALGRGGLTPADLPHGKVVALARLVDCIPSEEAAPSEQERAFGDYSPGRWVWKLENVVPLSPPLAARGGRRIWKWDENMAGAVAPDLFR